MTEVRAGNLHQQALTGGAKLRLFSRHNDLKYCSGYLQQLLKLADYILTYNTQVKDGPLRLSVLSFLVNDLDEDLGLGCYEFRVLNRIARPR